MKLNDFQLTEHFNLREFECPCCRTVKLDPNLVEALEELRRYIADKPIIVTSGYRCHKHNASPNVKGATLSDHLLGVATDIVVRGMSPNELAIAASYLDGMIKRIGTYSDRGCVHIGVLERNGFPSRWGNWTTIGT